MTSEIHFKGSSQFNAGVYAKRVTVTQNHMGDLTYFLNINVPDDTDLAINGALITERQGKRKPNTES